MFARIRNKYANWIYLHTSFPIHCESGNELNWIFKDNCPECLARPIETLSNYEYHKKYPARNKLVLGSVTIYLCDIHLKELYEELKKHYQNN